MYNYHISNILRSIIMLVKNIRYKILLYITMFDIVNQSASLLKLLDEKEDKSNLNVSEKKVPLLFVIFCIYSNRFFLLA